MSVKRVGVLHGVNLDQLGRRPAEHYPQLTLAELEVIVGRFAGEQCVDQCTPGRLSQLIGEWTGKRLHFAV